MAQKKRKRRNIRVSADSESATKMCAYLIGRKLLTILITECAQLLQWHFCTGRFTRHQLVDIVS